MGSTSPARNEHKGLAMEKTYNCKICGKAFSSGRVLGGHARSHLAEASLASRNKKSPVLAEKSESDSCLTDRVSDDGGRDSRKNPGQSVESVSTGEKKIGSWNCENHCGLCKKGFHSRMALFGHMRVHKQRGKGQRDHHVPSPGVRVSPVEIVTSAWKSSLEEALSNCEIFCPTMRRKRSFNARCSGNKPGGNKPGDNVFADIGVPLSTLLSSGICKDEIEAATGLLMISTGIGSWKYSDVVKNGQIGNDGEVLDDVLLGVGNKRRRLGEVDDAAPKMLKVPGYPSVKGKIIEYQIGCDMISGGVEVQSFGIGDVVEEMKSLVDVLEGEKIPDLSSDDELGGDNRKRMLSDTDCRKSVLTFKRRGYKCKSCGRIFLTQQELGDHRVTRCCSSANSEKTEDKKVNGEGTSSSHANGLDPGLSFDGAEKNYQHPTSGKVLSPGQAFCSHDWSHDNNVSEVSERNCRGAFLLDLNVPVEVFE